MSSSELSIADAMLRGFASAGIGCALVVGDQVPRVNSALCELVGAPREDALVAAIDEFVIVDHTARTSLHAFVAKWRAAPSHGTHRARTAVSFAGGSAVPVDIAIVAITSDTTLIQFHDLRERRRVEAQLVAHRDVARILNRATTMAEAFPDVLHAMAMPLGWSVGTIWIVDDSDEHLRLHARWSKDDRRFASFLASSDAQIFVRGDGLPGRVWASGQPEWIPDIATFAGFPRAGHATGAGLSSAAAFPFRVGDALAGVIECFSIERRAPDDGLLHSMAAFGDQIGHFIARARLTRQWKESDAWRVSLVESSLDAVVTIDHHGRVLEFNAAAEAMFRAPRESVIGREMAELIHPPALREQHRRGLARYLATGESRILSQRMQMRAERADGSPWSLELTVARVGDVEPPLFTGVVRDVTELERMSTEREQDLEALRAEAAFRERFIGILGHDLRNPIAAISFTADAAAPRAENDRDRGEWLRVARSARRMGRMVGDLLDFARSRGGGGIPVSRHSCDIGDVAAHVATEHEVAHPGRRVVLERDAGRLIANVDADRMAQAIGNLVGNAIEYSDPNSIVTLAVHCDEDTLRIAVHNDGEPIPAELTASLFDPFKRVATAAASRSNHEGLGLGLYITQQIALAHGGTVTVTSEEGAGTTFTIAIPRA